MLYNVNNNDVLFVAEAVFLVLTMPSHYWNYRHLMHLIFAAGSERRGLLCTKRSCPASEHITIPDVDRCCLPGGKRDELRISPGVKFTAGKTESFQINSPFLIYVWCDCDGDFCVLIVDNSSVTECVVCMERPASNALSCGHRCLCSDCTFRVIADFGTCPLCRKDITDSNVSLKEIPFF